jgi:hypothetical protein
MKQKRAARKILDQQKAIYSSSAFEYRNAVPSEFPDLDISFYDQYRIWLEGQGFQFLGDRENVTLTRIFPKMRTFIRSLVSADGTICGGIYHVKPGALGFPPDIKAIDFETELNDGTFLITTNTLESARALPMPGIDAARLPMATHPDAVLRAHLDRVAQALNARPEVAATKIHTMNDVILFQQRMQEIKTKHKKAIGFVGRSDLEKVRGRELNEQERGVVRELEKLKASEK